jgi:hypothetical protein
MKFLTCTQCGRRVFFENTRCENCGGQLGFVPAELQMVTFSGTDGEDWERLGQEGAAQKPCLNYRAEAVCNWMIDREDPAQYCLSCRTTRIIPTLGKSENRTYWASMEQAKRRLFYTLLSLGLPMPSRDTDPVHGVWFEFLEEVSPQERVLTGHDNGIITLNIAEADDAMREKMRSSMHEPYRTLVGHLRHESGHYYWDRLIQETQWIDEFRRLFGDERQDYEAALNEHYAQPTPDWQLRYISAYASSHPWEDWAECWAHYLHMVDGLETAEAWGMRLERAMPGGQAVAASAVDQASATVQSAVVEQWLPIMQFNNAMNRSMGLPDSYPFVVPAPVVDKLDFIHRVVGTAARGEMKMNFSLAPRQVHAA